MVFFSASRSENKVLWRVIATFWLVIITVGDTGWLLCVRNLLPLFKHEDQEEREM